MAKKDKLIVAVSGGVDSVVLPDMLARAGENNLIVAHIDHGIRPESAEDARFVRGLAQKYSCQFEIIGLGLGSTASEDLARQKRYAFLLQQSQKYNAKIVTAHHRDDMIGSIVINLHRGTGWRGLAVMNRAGIVRLYYLSHKSCCGGLTVCSCYCCYLALAIMICKFYLTPDRYSSISDYVCERSVNRYSRTYDHEL